MTRQTWFVIVASGFLIGALAVIAAWLIIRAPAALSHPYSTGSYTDSELGRVVVICDPRNRNVIYESSHEITTDHDQDC